MDKSPDAFRTISEVAEYLQTPAHVLRFWESRFPQVRPVKRAGGRRYYRPSDVALLAGIRRLLHDEGMTIRGVQKVLRDQGVRHVAGLSPAEMEAADAAALGLEEIPLAEPVSGETPVAQPGESPPQAEEEPEAAAEPAELPLFAAAVRPPPAAPPLPEPPAEPPEQAPLAARLRTLSPAALEARRRALIPLVQRLAGFRARLAEQARGARR